MKSLIFIALAILLTIGFAGLGRASALDPYMARLQVLKRRSDWVGLERLAREALAAAPTEGAAGGSLDLASASIWLADALEGEGRYPEAEPLYRRALEIRQTALGEGASDTVVALDGLGLVAMYQGHYEEADRLLRRALTASRRSLAPDNLAVALSENSLGRLQRLQSSYGEAETHFRHALEIREKDLGPEDPEVASSLDGLAAVLWYQGRFKDAEAPIRRALAIREKALGPDNPLTSQSLGLLALIVHDLGRYDEAEVLYRQAVAVDEKTVGPDHPDTALRLSNLGGLLWDEGKTDEVEPIFRRALAIREKALGPDHPDTAMSVNNLAFVLEAQGRHAEAETLYRRALAIDEKALGPKNTETAIVIRSLADLQEGQARYGEAEPLYRRALKIDQDALGEDHPDTADAHQSLGLVEEKQSNFAAATGEYRAACSVRSSQAGARERIGEGATAAKAKSTACSMRLSQSLWGWFGQGGGRAAADRPEALKAEAFITVQRAALSAAGDAMARSAALSAARAAGVGAEAVAYEDALVERDSLNQQFAEAAGETGDSGAANRQRLTTARVAVLAKIEGLAATLKARAPRYWDYRAPEPVSISALQARTGRDAALLRDDEALLVFMIPPGEEQGLVFAATRTRAAWARVSMTGEALRKAVSLLRAHIEARYRAFDRRTAYALHQALLGDPAIQAVIADKPVLLFVPAGPLTTLPPGLLITAPPAGGVAGDEDPTVLRATPWLLRSKAVALLPSVSSLRTLRQLNAADRAEAPDPLLAFADPDFSGAATPAAAPPPAPSSSMAASDTPPVIPRGFSAYFRDGRPVADALHSLPRLPGTRVEGEALVSALDARPDSLLLGSNASKAELMARNADGRLAKVRVLEFATHGLVAGAADWLAEPALAMAAGPRPEDELLMASEATTLTLNADWVLLSACNTASPDAPESQGLSGLSRAFFYAGARSLLVSHWPVRDDVTSRLIPSILLAERDTPSLGHAEALRRASLAILDNPALNAANPSAWAPFTLIGEADRR